MDAIALPPVLDTPAAAPLRRMLIDAIGDGAPVTLDASGVERVGQACLQVLASAEATAADRGVPFRIHGAAPAFAEMASLAGLPSLLAA